MTPLITIDVPGQVLSKGSMRGHVHHDAHGRAYATLTNDNPSTKEWQHRIAWFARAEMRGRPPVTVACRVEGLFRFERPTSDLRTAIDPVTGLHLLAKGVPEEHMRKPDIDKIVRVLLDALTGVAYVDDCQVDQMLVTKIWVQGQGGGVAVRVLYQDPVPLW